MSKLFRNVPMLSSLEVSPFAFRLVFVFVVVGLAWSAALRSPEGGALRAERKGRPTTVARAECLAAPSVALPGAPPRARDDSSVAPTSASAQPRSATAPHREPAACWALEFPETATVAHGTRW